MKLSLALPATAAELRQFADVAGALGADLVALGRGELVASMPQELATVDPAPPVEVEPQLVFGAPEPAAPLGAEPGTIGHRLLWSIACHDGVWTGSIGQLAMEAWPRSWQSAKTVLRRLVEAGLVSIDNPTGHRARAVELTADGWERIGRRPALQLVDDVARAR